MPRVEHVAAMNLRRSMINHSLPIAVIFSHRKRLIIWRAVTDVIATGTSVRRFCETSI
jgi:hypothetical protein